MDNVTSIHQGPRSALNSGMPIDQVRSLANARLNQIINEGCAKAARVIERVMGELPEDRIVASGAIQPHVSLHGNVSLGIGQHGFPMHRHARGQLLGRLGIPVAYADSLAVMDSGEGAAKVDQSWRRELLETSIAQHLKHADSRYLVRNLHGEVRGVLSDHYRRLDSRPLVEAFCTACESIGALPVDGVGGDLRTSIRAIIPKVYEPIEGEFMVFGLAQTNSDFGAGTYSISAFGLRLVCLNGMVSESALKQVHLGGKLPADIQFSAETYRRDTETMVSATSDIVRNVLAPAAIDKRLGAVRNAAGKEVNVDAVLRSAKFLTKAEATSVKEAYDGADVVMLPPGKTAWRFSNALSWVANSVEDPERKIELQQAAGQYVA